MKYYGKEKCRILKQIRAEIAKANDIEWVVSECKHKGNCKGTCPKCEQEVRQLEAALAKREALGKTVAVVGISASGGAAYVCNAVIYAREMGCLTVAITNNPGSKLGQLAAIDISADSGPEVLTGSTRLKAGNAQKMVLNMLSTGAMVRSGHVYENMMINLKPTNIKLRARVIRIFREITGCTEEQAVTLLDRGNWVLRDAIALWKKEC